MTATRPDQADPGDRGSNLDLKRVVAPFRGLEAELGLSIEDGAGTTVASNTVLPAPPDAATREISEGAFAGWTVRTWSGSGGEPLATAVAESIAAALGAVHEHDTAASDRAAATARLLEQELAHGRSLQRSFVSLVPPEVPGWDIATYYEAAREVGGDFFELFRLRRRGRPLSIVIADVTGKGVAAALLMAFSRPLLHAAIDHTTSPAAALERTNRILVEERRSSLFITALAARLDVRTGVLVIANAGHEPPLLVRADGSAVACLLEGGPLVGAFARLDIPEMTVELAPGDLALLYTDGVTDARSPAGERFDEWRLFEAVEATRGQPASEVVGAIARAVNAFQGREDVADDITVVAVRRLPEAS
jgi:serine phosphatase RsbU (regulator of sigma subunit)